MKSARGDGQQLDDSAGERGACFSEYLAEHLRTLGGLLNSEVESCRSVGFPNVRTDEPDVGLREYLKMNSFRSSKRGAGFTIRAWVRYLPLVSISG